MHLRHGSIVMFAVAAIGAAGLSGCYTEGGPGRSADTFTYISRSWQPWTIGLVDTRTGEEMWSVDVPVGQQLVVRFLRGKDRAAMFPDSMDWDLMKAGRRYGTLEHSLPVPGGDVRLLKPTLRPAPELPGAVLATRGPGPAGEALEPIEEPKPARPEPQYEPLPPLEPAEEPIELTPPPPKEEPKAEEPPAKSPTWDNPPKGEEEEPPVDLPEDEEPGR